MSDTDTEINWLQEVAIEREALVMAAKRGDLATVAAMLGIDQKRSGRLTKQEKEKRETQRQRLINGRASKGYPWTPMMAAASRGHVSTTQHSTGSTTRPLTDPVCPLVFVRWRS